MNYYNLKNWIKLFLARNIILKQLRLTFLRKTVFNQVILLGKFLLNLTLFYFFKNNLYFFVTIYLILTQNNP